MKHLWIFLLAFVALALIVSPLLVAGAACNDGVDNDGDGLVDMLDPDCHSPTDTHE